MTRFARFGERTKKAEDATAWTELSGGSRPADSTQQPAGDCAKTKKSKDKKSKLKGTIKDKNFKAEKEKKFSKNSMKKIQKTDVLKRKPFDPSSMQCYNCKETGHKASDCTKPSDGKNMEFECYNCKEKGHKAFQCPKPNKRDKKTFHKGDKKNKKIKMPFDKSDKDWKEKRSEHRRLKRQNEAEAKMVRHKCSFSFGSRSAFLHKFMFVILTQYGINNFLFFLMFVKNLCSNKHCVNVILFHFHKCSFSLRL